jgi:hypothetical protein
MFFGRTLTMKKLALLALLLSLGFIGCAKKEEPAPMGGTEATTPPATEATTP